MNRGSALVITLALGILLAPLAADAQQAGKVYRIGYVAGGGRIAGAVLLDAFRQGLRALGYVEGQNITIEYRWADGRLERLPDPVADLIRLKVDVIVSSASPAARRFPNFASTTRRSAGHGGTRPGSCAMPS